MLPLFAALSPLQPNSPAGRQRPGQPGEVLPPHLGCGPSAIGFLVFPSLCLSSTYKVVLQGEAASPALTRCVQSYSRGAEVLGPGPGWKPGSALPSRGTPLCLCVPACDMGASQASCEDQGR